MKPDLYNERTARIHYKRFGEILYSPGVLNLSTDITDSLSATLSSVMKTTENEPTAPDSHQPSEAQSESNEKSEVVENNKTDSADLAQNAEQDNTNTKKDEDVSEAKEAEDEYI